MWYVWRRVMHTEFWWENQGYKPIGRLIRESEDNTKINFREIGCGGMDWIHLALDRYQWRALVNTKLWVP
jgi:hypothetical protein